MFICSSGHVRVVAKAFCFSTNLFCDEETELGATMKNFEITSSSGLVYFYGFLSDNRMHMLVSSNAKSMF